MKETPKSARQVLEAFLGGVPNETSAGLKLLPAGMRLELVWEWLQTVGPSHAAVIPACRAAAGDYSLCPPRRIFLGPRTQGLLASVVWFRQSLFNFPQPMSYTETEWQTLLVEFGEAYENQSIIDRLLQKPGIVGTDGALIVGPRPAVGAWPFRVKQPDPARFRDYLPPGDPFAWPLATAGVLGAVPSAGHSLPINGEHTEASPSKSPSLGVSLADEDLCQALRQGFPLKDLVRPRQC